MRRWLPSALAVAALAMPALAAEPKTAVLEVSGMTCSLCPVAVRKALERTAGVLEARVDFKDKRAHAKYDSDKTSPDSLAKVVSDAGFPAKVGKP